MPRFLITRLSAIGDCIHTMPLVSALRKRFPSAYIAWATQSVPATLLDGYPGLDQTIVVDRNWLKSPRQIVMLRQKLRALKFDVTIDPQSLTKSAAIGWLSGARQRIGFERPQGREASPWLNTDLVVPRARHVVDRYLQLLTPLVGGELLEVRFELPVYEQSRVRQFLQQMQGGNAYAVLNPGAGWDSKLWLPDRFAHVARHLGERHQTPSVVVWAGSREKSWAQQIVDQSGGHAWLAPSTDLPELAYLLNGARVCVAADTGPLHLAAAVGTPCVGLFGSTLGDVSGPYGPAHVYVQAYYQDGSCRQRRQASNEAMQAIDVSMVTQACDEVLSRARSAAA
jgi:lipopolysaccharide heptosyltransferase I